MLNKLTPSVFDVNFILTLAGFPIITSLFPFISSIAINALILVFALISIFKTKLLWPSRCYPLLSCFLIVFFLVHIRCYLDVLFITDPTYQKSRQFFYIYVIGSKFIPILSVMASFDKINWKRTLNMFSLLLLLTVLIGIHGMNTNPNMIINGRVQLNERQSSLAFGDNGFLLTLTSLSLLFCCNPHKSDKFIIKCYYLFLIICVCVGFYGTTQAGSRGPFLSLTCGLFSFFVTMKTRKKFLSIFIIVSAILFFGLNLSKFQDFAPVLFERLSITVYEGDLSGRDILFQQAIENIVEHPLFGVNPINLLPYREFTTAHNGYLDVGQALGVIGLFVYIILNIILLVRVVRRTYYSYSPVYFFSISILFAYMMRAMSGAGLIHNTCYPIAISLACILLSDNYYRDNIYFNIFNNESVKD